MHKVLCFFMASVLFFRSYLSESDEDMILTEDPDIDMFELEDDLNIMGGLNKKSEVSAFICGTNALKSVLVERPKLHYLNSLIHCVISVPGKWK